MGKQEMAEIGEGGKSHGVLVGDGVTLLDDVTAEGGFVSPPSLAGEIAKWLFLLCFGRCGKSNGVSETILSVFKGLSF